MGLYDSLQPLHMGILTLCGALALVLGIISYQGTRELQRLSLLTPAPSALTHLDASTCCRYTHADLPALLTDLRAFALETVWGNHWFAHYSQRWADFVSTVPDLETNYTSNSYLLGLATLRERALTVMTANQNTLEDFGLRGYVNNLELVINLTKIDAYFMQTGLKWWDMAWVDDPWATAADTLTLLPTFKEEIDYPARVLAWLAALDAKATRWVLLAARALEANKTHSTLQLARQYELAGGHSYLSAFQADYSGLCTATLADEDETACLVLAESIEATLAAFAEWWVDEYMPLVEDVRPNSAPGLRDVPDGAAIYAILQRFHLGAVVDGNDLYTLGETQVEAVLEQYAELGLLIDEDDFETGANVVTALSDPDDVRFYLCTASAQAVLDAAKGNANRLSEGVSSQIGFLARSSLIPTVTGSALVSFQPGNFNTSKQFWLSPSYFNVPQFGNCTGSGTRYYDDAGALSATAHSAVPGRGLQSSLAAEMPCGFAPEQRITSPSSAVEGWAVFAEFLALEAGLYDTNLTLLGYYHSRALYDNALRADPCVHSSDFDESEACNTTEVEALYSSVGMTDEVAETQMLRTVIMPAYTASYRYGDILLQALRSNLIEQLMADGNLTLDDRDFNNLFLRFGGPDIVRDFTPLVATYASRVLGETVLSTAVGADILPAQLFVSGAATVGAGWDATCRSTLVTDVLILG